MSPREERARALWVMAGAFAVGIAIAVTLTALAAERKADRALEAIDDLRALHAFEPLTPHTWQEEHGVPMLHDEPEQPRRPRGSKPYVR